MASHRFSITLFATVVTALVAPLALAGAAAAADPGYPLWTRAWTGAGGQSYSRVAACPNGDVVVAGMLEGAGTHIAVARYSATGRLLWRRVLDPSMTAADWLADLAVDDSGNAVVAGTRYIDGTTSQFLVAKYRSTGRRAWRTTCDGGAGGINDLKDLALDGSGRAVVTGTGFVEGPVAASLTIKLRASDGRVAWRTTFTGDHVLLTGFGVAVDRGDNVYVTGSGARGDGFQEMVTVRLWPDGKPAWTREVSGGPTEDARGAFVATAPGGAVYVVGSIDAGMYDESLLALRYKATGTEVWRDAYDAPQGTSDRCNSLAVDRFGNAFVAGFSDNAGPEPACGIVARWTPEKARWTHERPFDTRVGTEFSSVVVDGSGGCFVAGIYETGRYTTGVTTSGYVARLGRSGAVRWQRLLAEPDAEQDVSGLARVAGGLAAVGRRWSGGEPGEWDGYLTKVGL